MVNQRAILLKMSRAIILAGGKGTRLLPYTIVMPKPMLPIGEIPIIEIISKQLKYYGFDNVTVSLGHLSGIIKLFLESKVGSAGFPNFDFVHENSPLGTSGPLKAVNPSEEDKGDSAEVLRIKAQNKMLPIHRYVEKLGLSEYVSVSVEQIPDESDPKKMSDSYLLVYYPIMNVITTFKLVVFFAAIFAALGYLAFF